VFQQEGGKAMGWLLFWIVLLGLPVLLGFGFAFEKILKRVGKASSHEDGA
jgi:ABC-type bacteriocin/lantibiotic exporter with double-glycine peptidase domain